MNMKKIILSVFALSILLPTLVFASFDTSLKYGSRGDAVIELQDFLQDQGFLKGNIDSRFGLGTRKAVIAFQLTNGLKGDGYFGLGSRTKANSILSLLLKPSLEAEVVEKGPTLPVVNSSPKNTPLAWDSCKNIGGIQLTIPNNMQGDGNGNCFSIDTSPEIAPTTTPPPPTQTPEKNSTPNSIVVPATVKVITNTSGGNIDPQNDLLVWRASLINNKKISLKEIRLREVGSISKGDLTNLRFYVDDILFGSSVASPDSNGYVTFSSNTSLDVGNHTLHLMGNIIGGSSMTFNFSLRNVSDIKIFDTQLDKTIIPNHSSYSDNSFKINTGRLVTPSPIKDTTPPIIIEIKNTDTTTTGTVIKWSTDEVATGLITVKIRPFSVGRDIVAVPNGKLFSVFVDKLIPATEYYVRIKVKDISGNESIAYYNFTTLAPASDITPPSIPTGLSVIAISSTQISLSWTTSTDNVAVTGYKIFRDGTQIKITTTNSYTDSGLSAKTSYNYTVSAYDIAGNESNKSVSASVQTHQNPIVKLPQGDWDNVNDFSHTLTNGKQMVSTFQLWSTTSDAAWRKISLHVSLSPGLTASNWIINDNSNTAYTDAVSIVQNGDIVTFTSPVDLPIYNTYSGVDYSIYATITGNITSSSTVTTKFIDASDFVWNNAYTAEGVPTVPQIRYGKAQ